ncbi:uncharacterized protein LOC117152112 [Bombus impatiens]|nr:uncharacterized protein LOC117152112 [Bombus impatiens]
MVDTIGGIDIIWSEKEGSADETRLKELAQGEARRREEGGRERPGIGARRAATRAPERERATKRKRERREAPVEEALYTGWILIRLPVSRLYAATSVPLLDQRYIRDLIQAGEELTISLGPGRNSLLFLL